MFRRGVDRPGIGDWTTFACAVAISLGLLFSGATLRARVARALGNSVFLPFRLALSYGRCPLDVRDEITRLRRQLAGNALDRAHLAELSRENERLRAALGFAAHGERTLTPAEVVGRSADRFGEMLILAAGESGAPAAGQAVVSIDGLVGCVVEAVPGGARARTIRHGGLPVSGMLVESRYSGVLRWDPRRRALRLEGIPLRANVQVGEHLITSGYGGIFPPGIPIGVVASARDDSMSLVKEIQVSPAADPDRIEAVFLLRE